MIEPCFNELSIHPLCRSLEEVDKTFDGLMRLMKALNVYGIKRIRYECEAQNFGLMQDYTLADYLIQKDPKRVNLRNWLMATLRKPYMDDDKEDLLFSHNEYKYVDDAGKEHDCLGLPVAYVMGAFAVGFDKGLGEAGNNSVLCKLRVDKQFVYVCCLTRVEHIDKMDFVNLMAGLSDLPIPVCQIAPEKKRITFP